MLFKIDSRIFKQFPGTRIGLVLAYDLDGAGAKDKAAEMLKQTKESLKRELTVEQLKSHPHVAVWRDIYKAFGAKPSKYLSSIESMGRRVYKDGEHKSAAPLVDLYNTISLTYLLPAGGTDLDTVVGDIELTIAGEHETPVKVLGEAELEAPDAGEVLYKDSQGAICRRWNWRECERTKITPHTRNALFIIEAASVVPDAVLEHAVSDLAHEIASLCTGEVSIALLDEKNPTQIIKENGAYCEARQWLTLAPLASIYTLAHQSHQEHEHGASQEHEIRVKKVEEMRAEGIEPWPAYRPVNATCHDVADEFQKHEHEKRTYHIAGRVISLRYHGKSIFAHLKDRSGKVQIYLKEDLVGQERFEWWKRFVDIGDIIWCQGASFLTKMGEVTVEVTEFQLLSKCLYPLPEKFHGLTDVEIRYRQRYLDLISSDESRARFKKRSTIVRTIRQFLDGYEFVEVETPMLHPIPGGAAAKPFMTHHNALDMQLYLRIAPELYLKRLVVGGIERVYEINRNFRNEGVSTRHNPEFTMLELYVAHQDYVYAMNLVEEMFRRVAFEVNGTFKAQFGDVALDFEKPFVRLSMKQAVIQYTNCNPKDVEADAIDGLLERLKIKLAVKNASWGQKLLAIFEEVVEPQLMQPTFIIEFPVEVSPLAKRNAQNPAFVDRFELFVCGMELSNSFNELNDPFDQAARFREQADARVSGDDEAHYYDADYIHALEYGLPPTVGVGVGIDRLTMLVTNTRSIRDVILFPTLKRK